MNTKQIMIILLALLFLCFLAHHTTPVSNTLIVEGYVSDTGPGECEPVLTSAICAARVSATAIAQMVSRGEANSTATRIDLCHGNQWTPKGCTWRGGTCAVRTCAGFTDQQSCEDNGCNFNTCKNEVTVTCGLPPESKTQVPGDSGTWGNGYTGYETPPTLTYKRGIGGDNGVYQLDPVGQTCVPQGTNKYTCDTGYTYDGTVDGGSCVVTMKTRLDWLGVDSCPAGSNLPDTPDPTLITDPGNAEARQNEACVCEAGYERCPADSNDATQCYKTWTQHVSESTKPAGVSQGEWDTITP